MSKKKKTKLPAHVTANKAKPLLDRAHTFSFLFYSFFIGDLESRSDYWISRSTYPAVRLRTRFRGSSPSRCLVTSKITVQPLATECKRKNTDRGKRNSLINFMRQQLLFLSLPPAVEAKELARTMGRDQEGPSSLRRRHCWPWHSCQALPDIPFGSADGGLGASANTQASERRGGVTTKEEWLQELWISR